MGVGLTSFFGNHHHKVAPASEFWCALEYTRITSLIIHEDVSLFPILVSCNTHRRMWIPSCNCSNRSAIRSHPSGEEHICQNKRPHQQSDSRCKRYERQGEMGHPGPNVPCNFGEDRCGHSQSKRPKTLCGLH